MKNINTTNNNKTNYNNTTNTKERGKTMKEVKKYYKLIDPRNAISYIMNGSEKYMEGDKILSLINCESWAKIKEAHRNGKTTYIAKATTEFANTAENVDTYYISIEPFTRWEETGSAEWVGCWMGSNQPTLKNFANYWGYTEQLTAEEYAEHVKEYEAKLEEYIEAWKNRRSAFGMSTDQVTYAIITTVTEEGKEIGKNIKEIETYQEGCEIFKEYKTRIQTKINTFNQDRKITIKINFITQEGWSRDDSTYRTESAEKRRKELKEELDKLELKSNYWTRTEEEQEEIIKVYNEYIKL